MIFIKILFALIFTLLFLAYYLEKFHYSIYRKYSGTILGYFGFLSVFFRFHVLGQYKNRPMHLGSRMMLKERIEYLEINRLIANQLRALWYKWEAQLLTRIIKESPYYKNRVSGKANHKVRTKIWFPGLRKLWLVRKNKSHQK